MRVLPRRDLSREVWRIAGPVVVGMVSQTLLNVVDTAMVGRLGATALAATGLGGTLSWMIIGSFGALHIGTQAVAARRYGEGNYLAAGRVLDNAVVIGFVLGLICSILMAPALRAVYPLFAHKPEIIDQGQGYVFYRLLGGLPALLIAAHRGFFNGVSLTKLQMYTTFVTNGANILFNYLFIFGNLGFPRMEAAGAGLASTIGVTCGMIYFACVSLNAERREKFKYYQVQRKPEKEIVNGILKLIIPTMIHYFMIMFGFSIFTGITARLGVVEAAVSNVTITIMSLSFLPGVGIGTAASTLIGQKLGEEKPEEAEVYGWESYRIGALVMGTIGICFFSIPHLILKIFTDDVAVIEAGIIPLKIVGLIQWVDAAGIVLTSALEGAGMNRWVMVAEIMVHYVIFLPTTLLFAFAFHWGLTGAWIAVGVYMIVYGTVVAAKFAGGSWKTVKV